jgi:hypothetical protein
MKSSPFENPAPTAGHANKYVESYRVPEG